MPPELIDVESVPSIVRRAETNYINRTVRLGEYVDFDMYRVVERITAYLNSKHTSGDTDSLGRDKPFFNIVTAAVNVWYRATDIDRKDITIRPDSTRNIVPALVATIFLQDWMRRVRFGVFLNEWGRTLAQYGSAICKFIEKDGQLHASVIPWGRAIVDPIDFDAIPHIEKFYLTPAQLSREKLYDPVAVKQLLDERNTRKNLDRTQKDQVDEFIEIYEVHGMLPLSLLTGNPNDSEEYRQQMHVISFMKDNSDEGKYKDFTLYKGREEKDPYMITHLIKEDGRTLSIGAVEYLFDAQWMMNHTVKNEKDLLDLASKMIFQTADKNYIGRNVLTDIEVGDIFVHGDNTPLTLINNSKGDIVALQNFATQWQVMAKELTSTPEAITGQTLPSGTPYSLAAYLGGQANSLFEIMTENKGLAIEEMLRVHIIPALKKKLNNKDEVLAVLDQHNLTKLDELYIPKAAIKAYNEKVKKDLIEGRIPSPYQGEVAEAEVRQGLATLGNMRAISPDDITWKEAFKDLEWEVEVGVTNEPADKQAVLTTLSTVLQTIASNPMALQDPNMKLLFNRILSYAGGVSPVELATAAAAPPAAAVPTGGGTLENITTQANGGNENNAGRA